MKILRKPVKAIVECPLCECEYTIEGKDWRTVREHDIVSGQVVYIAHCPNCDYAKKIIPGEVKCAK